MLTKIVYFKACFRQIEQIQTFYGNLNLNLVILTIFLKEFSLYLAFFIFQDLAFLIFLDLATLARINFCRIDAERGNPPPSLGDNVQRRRSSSHDHQFIL